MLPLERIFEAVARGNAELAGQMQAKKVAKDQDASKSSMTVTMKPSPTGGAPLVTVKDAPADLLNQTQESDLKQTYEQPRKRVEDRLRAFGFAPKSSDVQPENVDTFGERFRARRELGGTVAKSALMAGITGGRRDAQLVENLKNQRAAQNSATTQKFVNPIIDKELEAGRLANSLESEDRQRSQMYLTERNRLLHPRHVIEYGSEDDYMSAAQGAMQAVGGMASDDGQIFRRAYRTGRTSFLNERVKALSGEEGKLAIQSYGSTPEELDRFVDEHVGVGSLSDFERSRLRRTAKGLIDWRAEQDKKAAIAEEREARYQRGEILRLRSDTRAERNVERMERTEQRQLTNEAKKERKGKVDGILKSIEKNNDEIVKVTRDLAKPDATTPEERAFLTARRNELKASNDRLADQLPQYGVRLTGLVSQQEWDALIAAGKTPAELAAEGIKLRRKK